MDLAYQRQNQVEKAIQEELAAGPRGVVWEVRNLHHLDTIHDIMADSVVVVLAYSRSCGSCKRLLKEYERMSTQAASSRAGVVYCKHNVINEFDHRSDVANMFRIRQVPSFLYFVDGALVNRSTLPDSRTLYRPSHQVEKAMRIQLRQIDDHIRRLVFKNAPSAQKS